MQIEIKTTVETKTTLDVSFPLFLSGGDCDDHSPNSWDHYVRINEDGNMWFLTIRSGRDGDPHEYEFKRSAIDVRSELGRYYRGSDASSWLELSDAATFEKAIKEAQTAINSVPLLP